jgi:hypothetical protein
MSRERERRERERGEDEAARVEERKKDAPPNRKKNIFFELFFLRKLVRKENDYTRKMLYMLKSYWKQMGNVCSRDIQP